MVFLSTGPVISHLTPVNSKRPIYWQSHSWIKMWKILIQLTEFKAGFPWLFTLLRVHWFYPRILFTEVCALLVEWRWGPARLFLQMHLSQRRDAGILIVLGNLDWEKQRGKWKLKANSLPQRPCIPSFSACSENVSLTSVICKVISRSTMTARRSSATGGRANLPVALKRIFKRVLIRKYNETESNAAHYLQRLMENKLM